jgi:biotin carboxylase
MRVLLLLPAAGYANQDFQQAADTLGVEVITCADFCHQLAPAWGLPPLMSVPFDRPAESVPRILSALKNLNLTPSPPSQRATFSPPPPQAGEGWEEVSPLHSIQAVIASDDHGIELAAHLRQVLGLPGNAVDAVMRLRDKLHFRQLQQAHGLLHPSFCAVQHNDNGVIAAAQLGFPLVVKSRQLNASRGVIRANNPEEFSRALAQVRRIQARYLRDAESLGVLIESFIPGVEVALEGVLHHGQLQVLALFDKPDPLDGPTFEETIYVTPSRLPPQTQKAIADAVSRACAAADVTEGAIHAEARVNAEGVWLLEVAPRAIGGLCGRTLTATLGISSAEIVLRHALGLPLNIQTTQTAAGVMMIPIPATGLLQAVDGVEAARAMPYITGVEITAAVGQIIAPPPEGASYLGFIFSRAVNPETAEAALRAAHAQLATRIQPLV